MKFLTLEEIKQQLRIEPDFTLEDTLLTRYGESAERTICELCRRTTDDFVSDYGAVPSDIVHAALLLVTASYEHRSAVSMQNLSIVGYGFDLLVKPYMRLADGDTQEQQEVTLGSDVKILIEASLPDGLTMQEVDFSGKVVNTSTDAEVVFDKAVCIESDQGYVLLLDTDDIGVGALTLRVTFQIPDSDYPAGYRKEVVKINPHITVKG